MVIVWNKCIWNHPCTVDGKMVKEYQEWNAIKGRCKQGSSYQKEKPSCVGCFRDEIFSDYDLYHAWRNTQTGAGQKDEKGRWFVPEKDLLKPGNKCYGIEFVVFVPPEINGFLTRHSRQRSDYGKGVFPNGSGFSATIGAGERNKIKRLGTFKTQEEAQKAHQQAKNERAKFLAEKWKPFVDIRVYNALMSYDEELMCLLDELRK